jgi:probable rRNA maturation factor
MSPEGSTITFRRVPQPLRRGLERPLGHFASKLEATVAKGRPFDCLITTDAALRRLNREFRGKDAITDVLSFPAAPGPLLSAPGLRLGDLAISLPRARSQAREFGHSIEGEVRILMLHGLLHLLGMDHETDRGRMARAEKRWRAAFGLPNGLIERSRA